MPSLSEPGAVSFSASDQVHSELTANSQSGALQRVQGDAGVCWIEQTVECPAAGMHSASHRGLGEAILFHGGFDLIGEDLLNGLRLALFENALLGKEFVE